MSRHPLVTFFEKHVALTADEITFIENEADSTFIPKHTVLLEAGAISTTFYFVVKGCVRLYYLSKSEEKTAYFYSENKFVSSYESFTKQVPARHYLATVEDCQLIPINRSLAAKFLNCSPKFDILARIMMEQELSAYQEIISSFITKNAEERYSGMMEQVPSLLQRIPQHQIATYLGVTPETLSRIRKRITTK